MEISEKKEPAEIFQLVGTHADGTGIMKTPHVLLTVALELIKTLLLGGKAHLCLTQGLSSQLFATLSDVYYWLQTGGLFHVGF